MEDGVARLDRDKGIRLPERWIPWPKGVSQQARDMLHTLHANSVTGGPAAYPDHNDKEAWRAFVAVVNEAILANSELYAVAHRPGILSETTTIDGVTVHIATPENLPEEARGRVHLEIHGGGLVLLEGEGSRRGSLREAERSGVRTISIDYRVPPDFPYPHALDDCVTVYRALLRDHRPGEIIVNGISGGGNLAAAMILRAKDEGLPMPAGLILLTPEIDLTETGDTFDTVMGLDPVLTERLEAQIAAYAAGADLSHPYLSPLFGDLTGFPPTFLQSGTRDLLLSNTVRMHRALRSAGVEAELHVWEGMPHGGFLGAPEDDEISVELRKFMDAHWR